MRITVLLSEGAERDLAAIHRYIRENDGASAADRLLIKLLESSVRLAENPREVRTHVSCLRSE